MSDDRPPETKLSDELHYTDLGNSERLIRAHGDDLRFVATWGKWYVFDTVNGVWREDLTGEVVRRMKTVIIEEQRKALLIDDDEKRNKQLDLCRKMESEPAIRHAIALAQSSEGVAMTHAALDANPWLLICGNGALDLKTGELHPHAREFLCTKRTAVPYDPEAKCPRFLKFLDEVFCQDRELIEFVQRAIGYSVTGDTREHAAFICHGNGSNGKTTLLRVIEHALGDCATTSPIDSFLSKNIDSGGPRNDVARLCGARLVAASEIPEDRRLDEGLVKSLTGGDTITARFLHQEFFEFRPQFKLWIATNHRPHIKGTDEGIWRRIRLIPFKAYFPDEKKDVTLIDTLLAEAPGILAWIIRGCRAWQEEGLPVVRAVTEAVTAYRAEQDLLGSWIDDCCEPGVFETSNKALYSSFQTWCTQSGESDLSNKAFSMRLSERGYESRKTKNGRFWKGLSLKG